MRQREDQWNKRRLEGQRDGMNRVIQYVAALLLISTYHRHEKKWGASYLRYSVCLVMKSKQYGM